MTTRPVGSIRYARAKVTGPDGTVVEGQTHVDPRGVVTVLPRGGGAEVVWDGGAGPVKAGHHRWVIAGADGPITIERSGGSCGACSGAAARGRHG